MVNKTMIMLQRDASWTGFMLPHKTLTNDFKNDFSVGSPYKGLAQMNNSMISVLSQ